jgi:hypothetical protein
MENEINVLVQKLGIKPGNISYTLHAPNNYLKLISTPVSIEDVIRLEVNIGWLQAFYNDTEELKIELPSLKSKLANTGQLWITWPKRSSGISSNLTDNVVRQIGLDSGLVDVKIAAIDIKWSALKFVYRLSDR